VVDGFSTAGKSRFAAYLARGLGWHHLCLDHMAHGRPLESGRFADHLDRDRITKRIGAPDDAPGIVAEGVCLRDAVAGMRPSLPALKVYVARVSRPGTGSLIWHDGVDLIEASGGNLDRGNLVLTDSLRYHLEVKPHSDADYVLVRVEVG
jgi:hypothetical protein